MNTPEFEGGVERLVGIYGTSITETLVRELNRRYRRLSSEGWQTLVGRVIETSKYSPKIAHFREQESSEELRGPIRSSCGSCKEGWVQVWFEVRGYPYEAVRVCECSPHLNPKHPGPKREGMRLITHESYLEACRKLRESNRKDPGRLSEPAPPVTLEAPLPPSSTEEVDEDEAERRAIRDVERDEEIEASIGGLEVPEDF